MEKEKYITSLENFAKKNNISLSEYFKRLGEYYYLQNGIMQRYMTRIHYMTSYLQRNRRMLVIAYSIQKAVILLQEEDHLRMLMSFFHRSWQVK